MASPERMRKSQLLGVMAEMPPCCFVTKTMTQDMASTTTVRRAVARLEGTPSMPTLARMEVAAAKRAERRANTNHISFIPFVLRLYK